MSKFDNVLKKISEALPVTSSQPQQPAAASTTQPKPAVTNPAQQPQVDPAIVQELIAAKNEQQVKLALQKLQATQQKSAAGTQPAV